MKSKKIIIFALALLAVLVLSGCSSGPRRFSFEEKYAIDADLDPEARRMTYTETASIRNTGADSTRVLYFHIYGNKFKDLYQVEDGDIAVTSIRNSAGKELSYWSEQEGVLYVVRLGQALEPGETIELTFSCEVLIPDMANEYGVSKDGDLYLRSFGLQLAVFADDDWDAALLQKEGDGRHANIADYALTVRVPEEYTLACSGTEVSCETEGGVSTYVYTAENRRDVMLIAGKNYTRLERTVGSTKILGYFNEAAEGATRDRMDRIMNAAAFALEYFSDVFGEYPYDTLVVTNSGRGTQFAVSMEYSGFITVDFKNKAYDQETVTYHEVAHQWFYGLVGNDENHEPWLDEGFATFAAGLCTEARGNDEWVDWYWDIMEIDARTQPGEKVNVAADNASFYSRVIYNRGGMFLKELMDAIGKEDFLAILSDYCRENMYKIATTEDFLDALYAGTDVDVSAIVEEYIR